MDVVILKQIPQISESELEVMKVLWVLGQAGSSQIIEHLSKTSEWKPKTIQTLITRLVSKGAVEAKKTTAETSKGTKAYVYSPLVSENDYKASANDSFLKRLYNGSVNVMITSFVKQQKMSKEEIETLKKMLDEDI
jgi:BlaI family transcriptional regulator, penicillinase repressor